MWLKGWLLKYFIKRKARSTGFIDPFALLSNLSRFGQPAEVMVPLELLRLGSVLHARGLINSQAIQNNLDWIWPYWVECQFDPSKPSFIPRAFSLTHINLTHRNWTAVGVPGFSSLPIVDPRGLVTPFYDGWSIDCWLLTRSDKNLIPSKQNNSVQNVCIGDNITVITNTEKDGLRLETKTRALLSSGELFCNISVKAKSEVQSWLVVSVRPYNPEGVSFLRKIQVLKDRKGWKINDNKRVRFIQEPDKYLFSRYSKGDVYHRLFEQEDSARIKCNVGMATSAALFKLSPGKEKNIQIEVPLEKYKVKDQKKISLIWEDKLRGSSKLSIPNKDYESIYNIALCTLVLFSSKDIYAGPFTYKRFWFRDAVFIIHSMLSVGMFEGAQKNIDKFFKWQTSTGYFYSQEGEWDSNGEVLWLIRRFCELTKTIPPKRWENNIYRAASWIKRKRLSTKTDKPHSGLLPAGYSAEHLGPSDYYYWDNFWSIAGLESAGYLAGLYGKEKKKQSFLKESESLLSSLNQSLEKVSQRLGKELIPASPYRRMDSGAVGSLVGGYPLGLLTENDQRLKNTAEYLLENCIVKGGFFHDMSHSGINPYLTLHLAQVLLRTSDRRFLGLIDSVASLSSQTGQWPEAIHPHTEGGCMGDGQHVWAAAEWVSILRSMFVREEPKENKLILFSGIPFDWLNQAKGISFGPVPTVFGKIKLTLKKEDKTCTAKWQSEWFGQRPLIEIRLEGFPNTEVKDKQQVTFNV